MSFAPMFAGFYTSGVISDPEWSNVVFSMPDLEKLDIGSNEPADPDFASTVFLMQQMEE